MIHAYTTVIVSQGKALALKPAPTQLADTHTVNKLTEGIAKPGFM